MSNFPLTESLYYILLSVLSPNYGYGIMEKIKEMTDGRVNMGAGTLYGGITTLLERDYISLYSEQRTSRKKKEYVITENGKKALECEIIRLSELLENGKKELEEYNVI